METSKNGELYLIDNEKMLYLTLQDIDNKFNDPNRIPEEDSIIVKKLYGDDEYKKTWYFQKLCTYKKYIRICEYSITQGNDLRLDMIKLLEEEMRLACCDESDIVRTTSNLKKLSFETQGEEFVKKARDIVDSQIMDSKRVIIQNR